MSLEQQAQPFKPVKTLQTEVESTNKIALSVDCVIFGFDESKLKVLLIRSDLKKYAGKWSLLGDLVFPKEDFQDKSKPLVPFDIQLPIIHTVPFEEDELIRPHGHTYCKEFYNRSTSNKK